MDCRARPKEEASTHGTTTTILATGDVTVDWSFVDLGGAPTDASSMAWAWSEGFDVNAVRFAGGAARLADMLGAVADRSAHDVLVIGPALPAEALASPLDTSATRTFSSVTRFPASRTTDRRPVWRFERFWGRRPGDGFSSFLPPLEGRDPSTSWPSTIWGLDYRREPGQWQVLGGSGPPSDRHRDDGPLRRRHPAAAPARAVFRSAHGRRARRRASQDRRRHRLSALLGTHRRGGGRRDPRPRAWARPARVVVQLELSGRPRSSNGTASPPSCSTPACRRAPGWPSTPGLMPAYPLCYVAALAEPLAADDRLQRGRGGAPRAWRPRACC